MGEVGTKRVSGTVGKWGDNRNQEEKVGLVKIENYKLSREK